MSVKAILCFFSPTFVYVIIAWDGKACEDLFKKLGPISGREIHGLFENPASLFRHVCHLPANITIQKKSQQA
jgi:hypothetical protein